MARAKLIFGRYAGVEFSSKGRDGMNVTHVAWDATSQVPKAKRQEPAAMDAQMCSKFDGDAV